MSDHCEEQEMEQEALQAIFDDALEVVSGSQPFEWAVTIWPEQAAEPGTNHVGIKLKAKIPLDYPEVSLPEFDMELLKGLTPEHKEELLGIAKEEAEANMGMPVVFAVCEKLREWLADNNVKGMDDVSMYAQMMRREKEAEKQAVSSILIIIICVCFFLCANNWYLTDLDISIKSFPLRHIKARDNFLLDV